MFRFLSVILLCVSVSGCQDTGSTTSLSYASSLPQMNIEHGDFSSFVKVKNMKPNSHSYVRNPDGSDDIVERFYIDGSECQGVDCRFGSVRSAVQTNIWDDTRPRSITSPKQAWYSFEVFFPKTTSIKPISQPSTIIMVEFKESNECASFAFAKNDNRDSQSEFNFFLAEFTGGTDSRFVGAPEECLSYFEAKISNIKPMLGKWVRFEYFVRWSQENDGYIIVFKDGKKVLERNGRTCQSTSQCLKRNLHIYGLYQPNNPDLENINKTEVFYRNVSMAQKRKDLIR